MDKLCTEFFCDLDKIIGHIFFKSERTITPLRLQKTLYFLFAYYGSTYGQFNNDNNEYKEMGGGLIYPKYLFNVEFQAWQYGPVVADVYHSFKEAPDMYSSVEFVPETDVEKDVIALVDEVIKEVNRFGDFSLVERSHEDKAWSDTYKEGQNNVMNYDDIIEDYLKKNVI